MTRSRPHGGYWIAKAFSKNKGALHRDLGVPTGKKIPRSQLDEAVKQGGKIGRRARLAINARGFRHR